MTQQILRGAPATVTIQLADQNGNPRAALGAVTVNATRSDGTSLLSSAVAQSDAQGLVSLDLSPAQTATLDVLHLVWTEENGTTVESTVEIVGGFLFSVPEARQSSSKVRDTGKYSDAEIIAARRAVTEECYSITGRSFTPRYRRVRLSGRFGANLVLPDYDIRRIRSTSVDGYAVTGLVTSNYLTLLNGGLFSYGDANVDVAYEYGMDSPPERIKDAALLRLQSLIALKKSGVPDRAEYQIIEGRVFSLNRLRGGRTGIKEVDDAYAEWTVSSGSIASVPIR